MCQTNIHASEQIQTHTHLTLLESQKIDLSKLPKKTKQKQTKTKILLFSSHQQVKTNATRLLLDYHAHTLRKCTFKVNDLKSLYCTGEQHNVLFVYNFFVNFPRVVWNKKSKASFLNVLVSLSSD